MTHNVRTCLWFRDGRGPEAARFYCNLIPGSRVERSFGADAGMGQFTVTDFSLAGTPYQILDAGPHFTLTEAVSISVETDDQAETDRLSKQVIIDRAAAEIVYRTVDSRTSLVVRQYPDEARLRARAYLRAMDIAREDNMRRNTDLRI